MPLIKKNCPVSANQHSVILPFSDKDLNTVNRFVLKQLFDNPKIAVHPDFLNGLLRYMCTPKIVNYKSRTEERRGEERRGEERRGEERRGEEKIMFSSVGNLMGDGQDLRFKFVIVFLFALSSCLFV